MTRCVLVRLRVDGRVSRTSSSLSFPAPFLVRHPPRPPTAPHCPLLPCPSTCLPHRVRSKNKVKPFPFFLFSFCSSTLFMSPCTPFFLPSLHHLPFLPFLAFKSITFTIKSCSCWSFGFFFCLMFMKHHMYLHIHFHCSHSYSVLLHVCHR